MEQITNIVLRCRKEKNITQEELAAKLNVSRQTIIAIEKGNYVPSLALGMRIARFFNKSVEEVFNLK